MPSDIYQSWSSALIYLFAAVCVMFIFLTYCRRCTSLDGARVFWRRARRRHHMNENTPEDPPSHIESAGLASAFIHSLPAIQFREEIKKGGHGNTDCAVCLGEFFEADWLRLLPNCAHVFHVSCIDAWFHSHSTCPLCRTNVMYDFSSCSSSVSMVALLETARREDACRERPLGYSLLEYETLQNPGFRLGMTTGRLFESDSDESFPGMVSPIIIGGTNNQHTAETLLKLAHNYSGESSTADQNLQALSAAPEVPH